jgi:hypothetical protein
VVEVVTAVVVTAVVVEGIVAEAEVEAGAEAEEATVAGVVTSKQFFFLPRHHNKSKEGGTWYKHTL